MGHSDLRFKSSVGAGRVANLGERLALYPF
jgi:hypothetical protein